MHAIVRAIARAVSAVALLCPVVASGQLPRLTRIAEFGCESCGGPAQFAEIRDVAVNDSGHVLVMGSEAPLLRMFNSNGMLQWSAGTEGMGPGEYRRPMRAMLGPRIVQVMDLTQRRVTRLSPDGQFRSSALVTGFPAAIGTQGRNGAFVVLLDDFRGALTLQRWAPDDSGVAIGSLPPAPTPSPPGITFTSIAVAPDGSIALVRDINTYVVERLSSGGKAVGSFKRDLPRVKRSEAEQAAIERLRERTRARVRAEAGRPRPSPAVTPRVSGDPELKPHVAIDGLRYDDAGRLWVRTMRGDETSTVFDVFSAAGVYAGEVRLDAVVGSYSLAGRWLATAIITEEGFAAVRLYELR